MKTITETTTRMEVIKETKTKYEAFDGTVFDVEWKCKDYEKGEVLNRNDIIVFDALTNCLPFFYEEDWDEHDRFYIMPTTEEAVEAIKEIYNIEYGITEIIPNRIYFLESSDDWADCRPIEDLKDQVKSFFSYMNINVNFS